MTSKNLNNPTPALPYSGIGPAWAGVRVAVTETGFNRENSNPSPFGFNLGVHVGDDFSQVKARRDALQADFGVSILWLNQVHGCDVHRVNPFSVMETPNADASLSTTSNVALAIMTADCLPVVFAAFDEHGKALGVAAAHAGWRGLHAGVLQASARALAKACQVPAHQLKAWMGPAIGPDTFEVGQDVFDAFTSTDASTGACFQPGVEKGKYLADIYALGRIALMETGLNSIEGGGLDTLTDLRWFSHRRGQQLGLPAGRFATLIRLLPVQGV